MSSVPAEKFIWMPTRGQGLLLEAGLLNDGSAIDAWNLWKRTASPQNICEAETRLFPLVYHNFQKLDFADESMEFLKNEHRRAYRDSRLRLRTAETVAAALGANGIRAIFLKGIALAAVYYESIALRPMSDVDVLIEPEDFSKTVEVLATIGWTPEDDHLSLVTAVMNGCHFKTLGDNDIDLHWRLVRDCWNADKVRCFWEAAVPLEYGSLRAETLCATDQLFHTCCHGARYNYVSPIRWVSDAMMILRSPYAIDWERLAELGKFHRLSLLLYHSLRYVKESFAADVPDDYLARVRDTHKTPLEKMSFRLFSRPPAAWTAQRYAQELAFQYSTLRTRAFVKYLRLLAIKRIGKITK